MITVKLCHNVQLVLDQEQKQIFSSKTGRLNVCTRPVWWVKTLSLSKWESRYLATPHINWTFMGRRSEKSVRKLITLFVDPLAPFPRAMCINRQLLILWLWFFVVFVHCPLSLLWFFVVFGFVVLGLFSIKELLLLLY